MKGSIDKQMTIGENINKRYINIKFECLLDDGKIKVSCKKCQHSWPSSVRNAFVFHLACYNCHKGKGYSMDEIKILKYLHENYFPEDTSFRFAETGGQHVIRNLKEPMNINGPFRPPLYYQCDGFSRKTYIYDRKTKTLTTSGEKKGTIFEVLGDYHHSNPLFYKPNEPSPRKGKDNTYLTHKENYDYTMNRMQHITEQGYKVKYIWITDFKRYTLDLEYSERNNTPKPNLFDYMNVNKTYNVKDNKQDDVKLLYKGSQRYKEKGIHNMRVALDNAF